MCSLHYGRAYRGGAISDATCSIEDCARPLFARGWCRRHYGRWERHGDVLAAPVQRSAEERFWEKVRKTEGCWIWAGAMESSGYGTFVLEGRVTKAHRASWALTNGAIPPGIHILHKCDMPTCVNPDHLELGTHASNMKQKSERNRANAKLSDSDVRSIRAARLIGATYAALAAQYGVHAGTIRDIAVGNRRQGVS